MIRRALAALLLTGSLAHAQAPDAPAAPAAPATVDQHLAQVRLLYDKGDFVHARDELLAAYQLDPRPELLFALGQVEINLSHYAAAIDYYQRFIATGPAADQVALAQQAIGAARVRLAEKPAAPPPAPPPPPPAPPLHPHWDTFDTVVAAAGGAALLGGGGLVIYAHVLTENHRGTYREYNDRFSRARVLQYAGIASLAGGTIALGAALLRWRIHLVGGELQPVATTAAAGATWIRTW